jgi:hypothetical protein
MIAVARRKRIVSSPRFAVKIAQRGFVLKRKNTTFLGAGTLASAGSLDRRRRVLVMNRLLILTVALSIGSSSTAFSRGGGMGMHHSSATGGAAGTSPTSPGTNSLGTALSSGGAGGAQKGPPLGTGNPAVDREDARVAKMVHSICRGC